MNESGWNSEEFNHQQYREQSPSKSDARMRQPSYGHSSYSKTNNRTHQPKKTNRNGNPNQNDKLVKQNETIISLLTEIRDALKSNGKPQKAKAPRPTSHKPSTKQPSAPQQKDTQAQTGEPTIFQNEVLRPKKPYVHRFDGKKPIEPINHRRAKKEVEKDTTETVDTTITTEVIADTVPIVNDVTPVKTSENEQNNKVELNVVPLDEENMVGEDNPFGGFGRR